VNIDFIRKREQKLERSKLQSALSKFNKKKKPKVKKKTKTKKNTGQFWYSAELKELKNKSYKAFLKR